MPVQRARWNGDQFGSQTIAPWIVRRLFYIEGMLIETGFSADPAGSAPLDADRASALLWWRTENDRDGIDEQPLRQAAALATIVMDDGRPGFDDTFCEIAEFVAAMPF
jgi:hypothetical protein